MGSSRPQSQHKVHIVAPPAPHPTAAFCSRTLAHVIETSVLPSLRAGHPAVEIDSTQSPANLAAFMNTLLASGAAPAMEHVETLLARGMPIHVVVENLLVPAAVRLGKLWDCDHCDFIDVVRAMDHIHQIVMASSIHFCMGSRTVGAPHRILLAALPHERHRLGLCLVRADFWREGWDVDCSELQFLDDVATLVGNDHYDAVGISAARMTDAPALARSIARARKVSRNRNLIIIAGGHAFHAEPGLSAAVGADATASSGRDAVATVHRLMGAGSCYRH